MAGTGAIAIPWRRVVFPPIVSLVPFRRAGPLCRGYTQQLIVLTELIKSGPIDSPPSRSYYRYYYYYYYYYGGETKIEMARNFSSF